jgi:hypothetical protein
MRLLLTSYGKGAEMHAQAIRVPAGTVLMALLALIAVVAAFATIRGVNIHTGAMFLDAKPGMFHGAKSGMFHG